MRLNTRLFLFVAALLLLISIAVYVVPIYLLKRNNREDRKQFLEQMEAQRAETQARYAEWIAEEIATREATINAFLYLVADHSEIKGNLLQEGTVTESVWLRSSKLLSYSDELSFMEVEQDLQSAAITLSRTRLYLARRFDVKDDFGWIALGSIEEPKDERLYLGVWLPNPKAEAEQNVIDREEIPQIFLLFDPVEVYNKGTEYIDRLQRFKEWLKGPGKDTPKVAHDLSSVLFTRLEAARQYLIKEFGLPSPENERKLRRYLATFDRNLSEPLQDPTLPSYLKDLLVEIRGTTSFSDQPPLITRPPTAQGMPTTTDFYTKAFLDEVRRINDLELIAALGYLSSLGAIYQGPFDRDAPAGAARLAPGRNAGTAVLSDQAFSSTRLFDAPAHIKQYPPTPNGPTMATQFGLVDGREAGALTVVNVLLLTAESGEKVATYLTLGNSLNQVLGRLAQISGETSLLVHNGVIVSEVDQSGVKLSGSARRSLEEQLGQLVGRGFITLGNEQFYYTTYSPDSDWDVSFFTLERAEALTAPIKQFEEQSKQLTLQVSRHIIAVAVGVFVIALLILEILTRHFTRPIRLLAAATQQVAEGKLDAIKLPKASPRSKNEVTILTRAFGVMINKLRDREKLRAVLNKVVSKEIADEILKGRIHLGGEVREVTVLFADIRGFSTITENLPPEEVIVFINSYMTVMTEIIESFQGVIDKYVGDEAMALFGAPVAHPHSSLQAVLTAVVMRNKLREWNQERAAHGLVIANVGIGINTGQMVAGNMGAEDRLNYTVMGANVNLASRLCQEAKGDEILIAEQMLQRPELAKTLQVEEKTIRSFKGFSRPIKVYRVVGLNERFGIQELSEFVCQFDVSGLPPWEAHD